MLKRNGEDCEHPVPNYPGLLTTSELKAYNVAVPLVAVEVSATCCISLPSPYHFIRVSEGLVVTPYIPPVRITSISADTNGVLLQWLALTNNQFQAQWTPSLAPPAWTTFTNTLTSTNGAYSFLDDGSQSGGLAGARYYRLKQLP